MLRGYRSLTHEDAEEIAIMALGFLTSDTDRLDRFLNLTGWTPQSLKEAAGTRALLSAVSEHLASDESLLLTFAANASIDPAKVVAAARMFEFPAEGSGDDGGNDGGGDGD